MDILGEGEGQEGSARSSVVNRKTPNVCVADVRGDAKAVGRWEHG